MGYRGRERESEGQRVGVGEGGENLVRVVGISQWRVWEKDCSL